MNPTPIAADVPVGTDWRTYVPAPTEPDARPTGYLSVDGEVVGLADFLQGAGDLVLTNRGDGQLASVVLDYGTNVAGRPWLDVSNADGPAQLKVSHSESAHWAGSGDERGGHNASANPSRSMVADITGPGRIQDAAIQGGQRYQRIVLLTPGSVSLSAVGFRFAAFRATPEDYRGWFLSSSDELNRVWYESAYTTQINQLPADELPVAWTVDTGGLCIDGGTLAVLRDGNDWTDIVASFETRVIETAAGWVIRSVENGAMGILLQLRLPQDQTDAATLSWSFSDDGYVDRPQDTVRRYTELGSATLAENLDLTWWTAVRTTAEESIITVEVDGKQAARIDLSQFDTQPMLHGSFGFHEAWFTSKVRGEKARFRNLVVTDADGTALFDQQLDDPAVLDQFIGDGVTSPNPLPVILDGARRDRSVWSGDLIVQIPNVFYTTDAVDYVTGSIEYLNSWQEPDGRLPARMPPLFPPARPPQHGQVYSAVYSMHQITNVALHHLHTGDIDFVRSQWPALVRQLEYDRDQVDERDLYITDDSNGLDWDWYDGAREGAVTSYNIVYQHVLQQAATLAAAIGDDTIADDLSARAERTRTAVNNHLYDPQRHLYVLSDRRKDVIAQDANALAVIHGVVPADERRAVLEALDSELPQTPFGPEPFNTVAGFRRSVSPYASGFHLTALFEAGLPDRALGLIHDLWGHMAAPGPYAAGTVWELLNTDGTPGFGRTTSLAHGWACAPTVALSSHVLGVTPETAGFHRWRIAPQPASLAWARGRVPTPHGPIDVSWTQDANEFLLEVAVPSGATGTILVPSPRGSAHLTGKTAGGKAVDLARRVERDTTISFDITAAGRYTVKA